MNDVAMKVFVLCFFLFSREAFSNESSPTGLWKSYDDQGKPTGFIRLTEDAGVFIGTVERGLPEEKQPQFCSACKDERKNQPLLGMVIMKGVKAKADHYEGEEILDPFTGNTYRVKLKLKEQGKKMEVRGFVGLSLFGRNQLWERVE